VPQRPTAKEKGAARSNGTINIEALGPMRSGDTLATTAVFATAAGQFQIVHRLNPNTSSVSATRYGDHTWVVTTGDAISTDASVVPGDIAQLIQVGKGGKTTNVGLYHLPFELTVTCATCVAPLP
jgi:hypothetical protein